MTDDDKLIDFDAFRAEQRGEPLKIKIEGETYELAADLPAAVMLDYLRLTEDGDETVIPTRQLRKVMLHMFGAEVLEALVDKHRLTDRELSALFQQTMSAYTKKVARPNRAARRAKTSRSAS